MLNNGSIVEAKGVGIFLVASSWVKRLFGASTGDVKSTVVEAPKNKYGLTEEVIARYKEEYPAIANCEDQERALLTIAELVHREVCSQKNSYCDTEPILCRDCPFWVHGITVKSGRSGTSL